MSKKHRRMIREEKTVEVMINLYCHEKHKTHNELCPDCKELLNYAKRRLNRCPFQKGKTICANCKVHCYKLAMREKIREVMRYSGPCMIYHHPILAIFHFLDGLRKEPIRHRKEKNSKLAS